MNLLDDPRPDFDAHNEWLTVTLGLVAAIHALDGALPDRAAPAPATGPSPEIDPCMLAMLGLLALRERLLAALPPVDAPPPPAPPITTPPGSLLR